MKRFFTLLVCLLGFAQMAVFADDVLWVDYCDGQKATSSTAAKTKDPIDLAIRLSAERMQNLAGNEIRVISVGWPVGNPGGNITVWVRESQMGANVVEKTVTAASNWMEVELDSPYSITGENDCWVGVSFTPTSSMRSFISLAGPTHPDGSYYRIGNGEWASYASLEKGSLAIRAGVNGPNMPKHDISVTSVTTPRDMYVLNDQIPVSFTLHNNAFDVCTDPVVRVSLNGNNVAEEVLKGSFSYNKDLSGTISIPTSSIAEPAECLISVEALWADGAADSAPSDNVGTTTVNIVKPEFDLQLSGVATAVKLYQSGDPIGVTGTIKNTNFVVCTNPIIRYSINGGEITGEQVVETELEYGKAETFAIRIPTDGCQSGTTFAIDFELVPNNGVEDINPNNNKATLTGITVEEHPFIQKMVMEEATGTWCGFCVRGIVCMDEMNNIYPDRFIGIAIHNGDSFVNSIYDTWSGANVAKNGYPSCVVNRDGTVRDPNYNSIASLMKTYNSKQAEAEVRPTAWLENGVINMKADCYFAKASSNRKLYVAFAITEDHLKASQSNYYSGGGYGVMGGFENLPSKTIVDFKDVARGIWPEPAGSSSCSLPSAVEAMTTYSASYSLPVAQLTKKNDANVYVAALLIDGATRKIINGGKCAIYGMSAEAPEGVDTVLAPVEEVRGNYNLAGQRVGNLGHGLRIENGRKVIR